VNCPVMSGRGLWMCCWKTVPPCQGLQRMQDEVVLCWARQNKLSDTFQKKHSLERSTRRKLKDGEPEGCLLMRRSSRDEIRGLAEKGGCQSFLPTQHYQTFPNAQRNRMKESKNCQVLVTSEVHDNDHLFINPLVCAEVFEVTKQHPVYF